MTRFSRFSAKATLLAAVSLVTLVAAGIAGADAVPGLLSQINCINESGSGCDAGRALVDPHGLSLSGDGGRVLVASTGSDAIGVFERNRESGVLTQLHKNGDLSTGCMSEGGSAGLCQVGHGLDDPMDVTVPHDDKNVYVASNVSEAIAILNNTSDSILKQDAGTKGCISETGGDSCLDGHGLTGATSIVLNPQGGNNFVYVGGDQTIAAFKRNLQTGELTQIGPGTSGRPLTDGCVNDDGSDNCTDGFVPGPVNAMALSSDGKFLYAAAGGSPGALLIFARTPQGPLNEIGCVNDNGSNGCVNGTALVDPVGVALDRGKKNVYVLSHGSGAIASFSRNQVTGLLTPGPCISGDGTGGQCSVDTLLANVNRIQVAENNKAAIVTTDAGVVSFSRNKKNGILTQVPVPGGCLTDDGTPSCIDGEGVAGAWGVAMASSRKHVFVAGSDDDAVVALQRS